MVSSLLVSPPTQQKTDSTSDNPVYRLAMQWTLDENAKLTCQWVQVKN